MNDSKFNIYSSRLIEYLKFKKCIKTGRGMSFDNSVYLLFIRNKLLKRILNYIDYL